MPFSLESNQSGIETVKEEIDKEAIKRLESNQSGIETPSAARTWCPLPT
jgi:hypothetical protein